MRGLIFSFVFLVLSTFENTIKAQKTDSSCYEILNMAKDFYSKGELNNALINLQDTETCDNKDKKLKKERQELQSQIFEEINKQKNDAIKARKAMQQAQNNATKSAENARRERDEAKRQKQEAEQQKQVAEQQKQEAERQKEEANRQKQLAISLEGIAIQARDSARSANELNQTIINAFYFYENEFALAYQNGKYGFINKKGEIRIGYKYDHALPFDETLGWALVKKAGKEYYIDTLGNEYLLVRDVNYLDDKVFALDLSNRDLKAIPAEVFKNPQLKFLNLSGNQISRIASVKALNSLRNLEHLDLSNNLLTNLPDDVYKLTSLKTLQIRGNRLGAIPTALGRLVQLELLDLSANEIEKFPDSTIVNLQKLTRLDLSENKIGTIPSGIGQLKNLTRLYLQNNELKKPLPDEIGALSSLKDLNLSYNKLTELPTTLSERLTPLDLLDVSFNALTQLPPDLNVLLFFNCSGNRLTERPSLVSKPLMLNSGNPFNSK